MDIDGSDDAAMHEIPLAAGVPAAVADLRTSVVYEHIRRPVLEPLT